MPVSLAAAALGLFYLAAVPLKIAFVLRWAEGLRFGVGLAAFEARYARRAAVRRLAAPGRRKKRPRAGAKRMPCAPPVRALRYLLARTELDLQARVGLGDAALTALACGAANGLLRGCAAATGLRLRGGFAPDFAARAVGEISGIVTVRVGHIILGALTGAIDWTQGRLRHGQTSH